MRIALVGSVNLRRSTGGVENHIRYISRELEFHGHEILDFTVAPQSVGSGKTGVLGSSSLALLFSGFLRRVRRSAIARMSYGRVMASKPDVVWQHDLVGSTWLTKKLARRIPVVLVNHTGEFLYLAQRGVGRFTLRRLLSHCAAIIGPSKELAPPWLKNTRYITNGVDVRRFHPDVNGTLRERIAKEAAGRVVIVCPRRWAPTKGVDVFVRALGVCVEKGYLTRDDVLVCFAGNIAEDYPAYTELVNRDLENLPLSIILLGGLDHDALAQLFASADVVVIPSRKEATSLAALEAMASGACVVASDVGGLPEVVDHGQSGILVPPDNAVALAVSLTHVVREKGDRMAWAGKGRRRALERFSWSRVAEETEIVLRDVTTHRSDRL